MRAQIRLALARLKSVSPDAVIEYVALDHHLTILSSGQVRLQDLKTIAGSHPVIAIIHPDDAVVATISLPDLPASKLDAAVLTSVEPMILGEIGELSVAHGPRQKNGQITVAWANRKDLMQAWTHLLQAGIKLDGLVPCQLATPAHDDQPERHLSLPATDRWTAPLPGWSLASTRNRPSLSTHRWRSAIRWSIAASALWIVCLNLYALQLDHEVKDVKTYIHNTVRNTFPEIPTLLDPVVQARKQLALNQSQSGARALNDFIALAEGSAEIMPFAKNAVTSLLYEDGELRLVLSDASLTPADIETLNRRAGPMSLSITQDPAQRNVWVVRSSATDKAQASR